MAFPVLVGDEEEVLCGDLLALLVFAMLLMSPETDDKWVLVKRTLGVFEVCGNPCAPVTRTLEVVLINEVPLNRLLLWGGSNCNLIRDTNTNRMIVQLTS
jgi:hypothetical protein